ncbi:MAG: ABC transporter substrate-binding protein, partial [Desulfobacteraceae bacterium]
MKIKFLSLLFVLILTVVSTEATASESKSLMVAKPFGPSEAIPDPAKASNGWYTSEAGVTETLFILDFDMQLKPWLAKSYENLTPLTWEIRLKQGIHFHDGELLDADAVKWSIERLIDEKSPVFNKQIYELLDIKNITVKDKHVLVFETKQPNAFFPYNLVSPAAAILSPKSGADKLFATGPFVLKKVIPNEQMDLSGFDKYWEGKVQLDKVTLKIIENPATRMLGFESGQLDLVVNYPEVDAKRMLNKKGLHIVHEPTNRLCFFFVRVADGPLKDKRIRQAINHAINRKELVEAVL